VRAGGRAQPPAGSRRLPRRLAADLAAFHKKAVRSSATAAAGAPERVLRSWRDNAAQVHAAQIEAAGAGVLDLAQLDRVAAMAEEYICGRERLLRERVAAGRCCDGHGDLLADDVFCLDDGPRALDCLEFDDALRYGDVLADVAFLVMDLERLGRPDLGDLFAAAYREHSGDSWPASLLAHYVAYRAQVRAKVAGLRAQQGVQAAGREAAALLDLAERRLRRGAVRLILLGGPPGSGKSSVARALSARCGWALLRSDVVRKELAGVPPDLHRRDALGRGIYTPEATRATYAALLDRARDLLERGSSVVLDASWSAPEFREKARALATATRSTLRSYYLEVPAHVAARRLAAREAAGDDPSDAGVTEGRALRARFRPWPEATVLDGTLPPAELAARCAQGLGVDRSHPEEPA
jgi:predicted kinase